MIHLMAGCTNKNRFLFQTDPDALETAEKDIPIPETRFLVFSDPHYYDTRLGTAGPAFQHYLDNDRKLLTLSDEIIGSAVQRMAGESAQFVLVCGDMTKDGEMACHQGMIRHLHTLKNAGKKVFVVPGNHDINNPEAVRYAGDRTQPVPAAGPDDFRQLYRDFGYGSAAAVDEDSLSYVTEPLDGLWLLALDSCRWKENKPGHHAVTGGGFSRRTLQWIENRLITAKTAGKAVIVFLHHGIMEHYPANKKFYGEYLVSDADTVTALLSAYRVPMVFTGHFHAQDITRKTVNDTGRTIHDIETGSMVTAPCPYRIVSVEQAGGQHRTARIQSRFIRSIPSMGDAFASHAEKYVLDGTKKMADAALGKYRVSKKQKALINHQVARSYLTHLKGDEILPETVLNTKGFSPWLRLIAWMQQDLLEGWYTDLPPRDNEVVIRLTP